MAGAVASAAAVSTADKALGHDAAVVARPAVAAVVVAVAACVECHAGVAPAAAAA